ncbi:MAG: nitroreductase [Acidovorax sp.]|uniref:nitroreductase family protein n=1 Tax=Acidovorax sp. TaxID=1872122 RepID=UPI00391B4871
MTVIPWPRKIRAVGNTAQVGSRRPAAASERNAADDLADMAATLIESRQTHLPKRLGAPAPNPAQLANILSAAAHAPDHRQLLPWRFVLLPEASRPQLAEAFAAALRERDDAATEVQQTQAREKAYRAPLLLLVVVDGERGDPEVDLHERLASAGCAVQNMMLMATAQGFGSALTSGKALKAEALRGLFGLAPSELALCFLSIGTVLSRKSARPRPAAQAYVSTLDAERGVVPGF